MDIKLCHIPGIVIGIKLRNEQVKFYKTNISIRYIKSETTPGSFIINELPADEYICNLVDSCLLIEKEDQNFKLFEQLEGQLNCISYSYNDMDIVDEVKLEYIFNKLENIIEENLSNLLEAESIQISSVSIEYN